MLRTIFVAVTISLYLLLSIITINPIFLFIYYFVSKKSAVNFARRMGKIWGKFFIYITGSKVEVIYKDRENFEKIKDQACVVVANHQSNMDIPLLLGYLPKEIGFLAKKEMENWPIIGMWMKNIQCIFLNRKDPREGIKSIKEGIEKIKNGYSVVVFPEGTRSETGEIGEFKKGTFKLASDSGVIILPITIKGTLNIQGKGTYKITGSKVILIVDKYIEVKNLEREEKKELSKKVKDIIIKNYDI